ncbi:hypothetical protein BN7_348 [Wickerhamomyces ciferrii]|uniref:Uncharacterized protein n=1 Tax=Wickerhamomyces ciferrii (strain ATCC 14091 / BCRC 22168 / CBS 111 / JCM 3599 / NBRC 0793 / NRRL Y-1031 F-60-10) TaxID=1206466 RepID=K0KHI6_WICCF|nr:uncharacterized protein BN7_348 [Wickerhamomyces ciferrii]CCH40814.1 hypothetical protein BN7_348 [Wickerhamomyces ciferrii]
MTSVKAFNQDLLVPFTYSGRSHKLIVLPNGILTLLISDPTEDLASAALCVAAGAHNDPDEIPGLAHFCEHLILLGSKEFPNPSEFHDSLSKSGGRRNAFTTGEQTCYFFETPSDSTWKNKEGLEEPVFNHLLKVFASSLRSPSFSESAFEKEIYAVDNEHNANKSSAGRLMYHGLRLMANENHPFHRFATGNYFSLNDLPKIEKMKVREHLFSYYHDNYVADKMTLVIRGSQSINLLQKLALSNFGDISTFEERQQSKKSKMKLFSSKNKESVPVKIPQRIEEFDISSCWKYETSAFTFNESNSCILIKKDQTPTLRLSFPVHFDSSDPLISKQVSVFENAWSNIVGDESEGSLDSCLKQKDIITSLSGFIQHISRGDDVLIIEIKLTNTGAKKIPEVLDILFNQYIPKVFSDETTLGRYLSEMESIDLLNYLHKDSTKSPMDESSIFSQTLQKNIKALGTENILKGSPNFSEINEGYFESTSGKEQWTKKGSIFKTFIMRYFKLLNLNIVFLAGSQFIEKASTLLSSNSTSTDFYFNYEYISGKLKIESIPRSKDDIPFHMVDKNIFIPQNALQLSHLKQNLKEASIKASQSSLGYNTKNSWSSSKAKLVKKTDKLEVWTKSESSLSFHSRLVVSFDVLCNSLDSSVENTMHIEILAEVLKIKLERKLYGAELLDYTWEVFASSKGDSRIGFTISGFKDGVKTIVETFVQELKDLFKDPTINSDYFRKSRVSVRSRYRELTEASSFVLASTGLLVVMEENIWSLEDRLDALDDIDAQSFKEFVLRLGEGNKYLKLFSQGETDCAEELTGSLDKLLRSTTTQKITSKEPSTVLLAPGTSYHIERLSSVDDPMNSIAFFIQTGPRGDAFTEKVNKLVSYLMSFNLVPDLRDKRQLGYVVLGGQRILRTTIGIHVTIMSVGFTPQYLEQQIDGYLANWEAELDKLSEAEFKSEIIDPFLKNYKQTLDSSSGPESLTADLQASVGSSNASDGIEFLRSHKKIKDLIFMGAYSADDEAEDKQFFNSLKKSDFIGFFKQRISPNSKTRAQLSVMLKSQMSAGDIQQQMMRLQLEAFLKMHGLRISSATLKEIVESTKGSSVSLLKELFKYFMSQGESFKLCTVVLKEVVKQTMEGVKSYKNTSSSSSQSATSSELIPSKEITDITQFQKSNKIFYRD